MSCDCSGNRTITFDLKQIIESKRRLRRDLTTRPISEKLAMLDALRERAVTIGRTRQPTAVYEAEAEYGGSVAVNPKTSNR